MINEEEFYITYAVQKRFLTLTDVLAQTKNNAITLGTGEVTKSKVLGSRIKNIEKEAGALVSSFNAAGAENLLTIQAAEFPNNIFRNTGVYRIIVSFGDQIHWMIRFVTYPDRTLALQLVRVRGKEHAAVHDNFMLTNDSINLVLTEKEFWVSFLIKRLTKAAAISPE